MSELLPNLAKKDMFYPDSRYVSALVNDLTVPFLLNRYFATGFSILARKNQLFCVYRHSDLAYTFCPFSKSAIAAAAWVP